jgi:hypothetical protein
MAAVKCSESQDFAVPGSPIKRRERSVIRVATAISTMRRSPMYFGVISTSPALPPRI